MKVRSFLFIGGLFLVICLGWLSSSDSVFSFTNAEVVPYDKWGSILIGKWSCDQEGSTINRKYLSKGEIEFLNNGEYIYSLTIERYQGLTGLDKPKYSHEPTVVVNGTINGRWHLSSSVIFLKATYCGLRVVSGNPEDIYSDECFNHEEINWGNWSDATYRRRTHNFSNNKIIFIAENLPIGEKMITVLKRK